MFTRAISPRPPAVNIEPQAAAEAESARRQTTPDHLDSRDSRAVTSAQRPRIQFDAASESSRSMGGSRPDIDAATKNKIDFRAVLRMELDRLDQSTNAPRPPDVYAYLKGTYLPSAIAILVDSALGAGFERRGASMRDQASREIKDGAVRFALKLPRELTAADWLTVYHRTIGSPAFEEHQNNLSDGTQKNLKALKNAMLQVLSGKTSLANADGLAVNSRPVMLNLGHMKTLVERYDLLMNAPTERLAVDFTQTLCEPKDDYLALIANRLELIGKSRFDALMIVLKTFKDIPLVEQITPYLLRGTLPDGVSDKIANAQLDGLKADNLRAALLLMLGDGGGGKSTVAGIVCFILGIDRNTVECEGLKLDSVLGSDDSQVLRNLDEPDLEKVFGILPVRMLRADFVDVAIQLDNLDMNMFGEPKGMDAEIRTAASRLLTPFDPDNLSIHFKSIGEQKINARGLLPYVCSNGELPTFPPGSNLGHVMAAFLSRVSVCVVRVSEEEKVSRLNLQFNELGVGPDHPVRRYAELTARNDAHHGGLRAAGFAARSAVYMSYFNAATGFYGTDCDEAIKASITAKLVDVSQRSLPAVAPLSLEELLSEPPRRSVPAPDAVLPPSLYPGRRPLMEISAAQSSNHSEGFRTAPNSPLQSAEPENSMPRLALSASTQIDTTPAIQAGARGTMPGIGLRTSHAGSLPAFRWSSEEVD